MSEYIKTEIEDSILQFKKGKKIIKVPKVIGNKYIVKDLLSVGGYGAIFIAENKSLRNREVLIKASLYDDLKTELELKNDISRDETIKDRRNNLEIEFKRLIKFRNGGESRMPSAIDLIYDYSPQLYGPHRDKYTGEEFYLEEYKNNEVYMVMQKIDGINLGQYVSKGIDNILKEKNYSSISMWEKDVLEYMKEVSDIISSFHRRTYVDINNKNENYFYHIYQDLKPDNIMITYDKFITLIDFGGLLMVLNNNGKVCSNIKNQGIPGCGTEGYRPREMWESPEKLDDRVDIYTIGSTMYNLLTGKRPVEGLSGTSTRIPVDNLRKMGYSEEITALVEKATNLDKNERYESVRYLTNDIKSCLGKVNTTINRIEKNKKEIIQC